MPDESLSPLPFVVVCHGIFMPDRVRVAYEPAPRPTTPALEALIAVEWERQVALARQSDRVLFDGRLLRYVRHEVRTGLHGDGASLKLTVGPTSYRDFVGTNLYNHHRLDEFGWERFANPIGTTATLITRDGRICYGRRSDKVAYHASHVHTFGGALEEGDRRSDGEIDAFGSVLRELHEELGLREGEVLNLRCVGLIRDTEICQPELLFEGALDMTAEDLAVRWQSAESRDEHAEIVSLPDEPEAIVPFVRGCGPIAPVAVGALFLHGRLTWGEAWHKEAAGSL
jgi:hypothetical protein